MIIIDDASTDNSLDICASFLDDRISIISLTGRTGHFGVGRLLNIGISLSKGSLLAICDSDDLRYPDSLQREVVTMEGNALVGLVASQYDEIDQDGRIMENRTAKEFQRVNRVPMKADNYQDILVWRRRMAGAEDRLIKQTLLTQRGLFCNPIVHSSVLMSKAIVQAVGGYSEAWKYHVDVELFRRIAKTPARFVILQEILGAYRQHPHRLTVQKWKEKWVEPIRNEKDLSLA